MPIGTWYNLLGHAFVSENQLYFELGACMIKCCRHHRHQQAVILRLNRGWIEVGKEHTTCEHNQAEK